MPGFAADGGATAARVGKGAVKGFAVGALVS